LAIQSPFAFIHTLTFRCPHQRRIANVAAARAKAATAPRRARTSRARAPGITPEPLPLFPSRPSTALKPRWVLPGLERDLPGPAARPASDEAHQTLANLLIGALAAPHAPTGLGGSTRTPDHLSAGSYESSQFVRISGMNGQSQMTEQSPRSRECAAPTLRSCSPVQS